MPSPNRAMRIALGLALTVAAGVSALFLTIGPISSSSAGTVTSTGSGAATVGDGATGTTVIVEYVDQYGNPIDPDRIGTRDPAAMPTTPADGYDDHDDEYEDHDDEYEDDDHHDEEHEDHEWGGHDDDD